MNTHVRVCTYIYTHTELAELDNSSRVNHLAKLFFFPRVWRTKGSHMHTKGRNWKLYLGFAHIQKEKAYSLFSLWSLRGQE